MQGERLRPAWVDVVMARIDHIRLATAAATELEYKNALARRIRSTINRMYRTGQIERLASSWWPNQIHAELFAAGVAHRRHADFAIVVRFDVRQSVAI